MVGALAGGDVVAISSTGVEGHWSTLRDPGRVVLGVSGSVAQGLVALAGWRLARRGAGQPNLTALVGWALFAVNAWAATLYLVASPALGFGDWMDVLSRFAALGPLRVSASVTGLFAAGILWRATTESLARLVGGGAAADRTTRARRLVGIVWLAGGVVAITAGAVAPTGPLAGAAIGAGSSLGATWPMLLAARGVGMIPVPGAPLQVARTPWLLACAAGASLAFAAFLGPGIRLG